MITVAFLTNSVEVAIIHVTALWTSIYITVIFEELRDFLRDFLRDVSILHGICVMFLS